MHRYKTHVNYRPRTRARKAAEEILAELLLACFGKRPDPILVAIGGPGGTGKSSFCQRLAARLPEAAIVTLDDYKTAREIRAGQNLYGAHPNANKMDLIEEHLKLVKAGMPFEKPVYDAVSGDAKASEIYTPVRFNLLDGEISTYRQFRDLVDFAVFIDSDWKTQLETRITRDIQQRGYSREKAIATFLQSNLREFATYGAESKNWADVHLYCHDDYRLEIESVDQQLFTRFDSLLEKDLAPLDLSGLIVPVLTPFGESDAVDQEAFIRHLEFLAEHGVRRILVNGTTGEFFSLSLAERKLMLTLARRYFPGAVLFQAGSDSLVQTQLEARWGQDYGADAIVVLPPYYFAEAPEQGLVDYFNALASQIEVPFILYNFPSHTQNPLTAEILKKVHHFGLKDSSADLSLIHATPHYYLGWDPRVIEAQQKGAYGFISSHANICPDLFVGLEKALRRGDDDLAARLQKEICRFNVHVSGGNEIAKLKFVLAQTLAGYPFGVRLPLLPLKNHQTRHLESDWRR